MYICKQQCAMYVKRKRGAAKVEVKRIQQAFGR